MFASKRLTLYFLVGLFYKNTISIFRQKKSPKLFSPEAFCEAQNAPE